MIQQIRLQWDQGSLLKLVDVIGSRGRNWPIQDGKDQIRLINTSAAAVVTDAAGGGRPMTKKEEPSSRSVSPGKKHITDPHASLALFAPRTEMEDTSQPAVVATRTSAKPEPREYGELFVGGEGKAPSLKGENGVLSQISNTDDLNILSPKGGSRGKFRPSRLFDDENAGPVPNTDKHYKSDPRKYNHFEFGDEQGGNQAKQIPSRPKSQHQSQWAFEDFNTPEKARKGKGGAQTVRHFGWSDDDAEQIETPGRHPRVAKPRRDAETHFEFVDDGVPLESKRVTGRPKGTGQNTGLGLYKNNIYDDSGEAPAAELTKRPLSSTTNGLNRKKDFDTHFAINDKSPSGHLGNENKHIADDRQKAVKMMDSHWQMHDSSPHEDKKIYKTAGNGMGSRAGARGWGIGEDSAGEEDPVRHLPGKQQQPATKQDDWWDF